MITAHAIFGLRIWYQDVPDELIQRCGSERVKVKINNLDAVDAQLRFIPAYRKTDPAGAYMALSMPFQPGDIIECEAPGVVEGIQLLYGVPDGDYVMCPVKHHEEAPK